MKNPELVRGGIAVDDRGSLRFINDFDFKGVKRFYQVENHSQGFIRAWHGHLKEGKYVYVDRGTALVGVTPLVASDNMNEPGGAYAIKGPGQKFTLSSKSPAILYIPPGNANGFKNLEADTTVIFFSTTTLDESKGDDIRFDWDAIPGFWDEDYR